MYLIYYYYFFYSKEIQKNLFNQAQPSIFGLDTVDTVHVLGRGLRNGSHTVLLLRP